MRQREVYEWVDDCCWRCAIWMGYRLYHVLRLRKRPISISGTTEESELMELCPK
jgi:hypothetical protein